MRWRNGWRLAYLGLKNHSKCRKTICFWIWRLDIFIYTCSIYYAITFPFWTYYIPLDFWTSLTCTPFPSLEAPGSCWWVQQRHLHHIRPSLRNGFNVNGGEKTDLFSSEAPSSWWHLLFFTKKKREKKAFQNVGHPTVFQVSQQISGKKSSTADIVSGRMFFSSLHLFLF